MATSTGGNVRVTQVEEKAHDGFRHVHGSAFLMTHNASLTRPVNSGANLRVVCSFFILMMTSIQDAGALAPRIL